MKIGPLTINLAKPPAPTQDREMGTAGQAGQPSLFKGEVIKNEKLQPEDFNKMRQNDGTVSGLYNILFWTMQSANWTVKPADDSSEAKAQAQYVEDCFRRPQHDGGMSTPFNLVIADMCRAIMEGYRTYEKVYELNSDGKLKYRKIASRDNSTVTLLADKNGGFNGFRQQVYNGENWIDVTIRQPYAFLYTFGKEKNWLKGESAFRAAYYHYEKKHKLYYVAHQMAQFAAIPAKKVKSPPKAKQTEIDAHVALADRLGFSSTIGLPDGWDLEPYDSGKGRYDPMKLIDHHNAEMARSILAQFMMLGTGGESTTGSWALSQDQSDVFVMAVKGMMSGMAEHITSFLVADLIQFNFANPKYPTFEFADITDAVAALLKEVFKTIVEKRPERLPDEVIDQLVAKMAAQLGIDTPKDPTFTPIPSNQPEDSSTVSEQSRKGGGRHFLADKRWKRPLTAAETRVDFTGIQKKYDDLEDAFIDEAKPLFEQIRNDIVTDMKKLLEAKDYKGVDSYSYTMPTEYRKLILGQMIDAYGFAKNGAADELGVGTPATPVASRETIKSEANQILEKQAADILFEVKAAITTARRKNQLSTDLSIGDVLATIGAAITAFYDSKIAPTAAVITSVAINIGRDDVFRKFSNKISKYQYSALLDDVTCPICEDLDATIVDEADYESTKWKPPIHINCRCIWVAIMADEEEQPAITGFPSAPGGATAPALSRAIANVNGV